MKTIFIGIALFGALTVSAVAQTDQSHPDQRSAPQSAASTDNEKVCGVNYHEGGVINKRICITRSMQRFNMLQTHQNIREMQQRSLTRNNPM